MSHGLKSEIEAGIVACAQFRMGLDHMRQRRNAPAVDLAIAKLLQIANEIAFILIIIFSLFFI